MVAVDRTKRWQILLAVAIIVLMPIATIAATTTYPASSGVVYQTNSGFSIALGSSQDIESGNPFADSNTVVLQNVTFTASGGGSATVDVFEGSVTSLSGITVSSTELAINPGDKQRVDISGGFNTIEFRSVTVGDGVEDLAYNATSSATLQIHGLASGEVLILTTGSGDQVGSTTVASNGTATFSPDVGTYSSVYVRTSSGPGISNIQPSGKLSSQPTEVSAQINDSDFSADVVNVTATVDGSQVGQANIISNQTVSFSLSQTYAGGEHTVEFTATDASGVSATDSATFKVPDTLYIYNETSPTQLVNGTNVTVKFFDGTIIERTTDTGTVNLTGLPVSETLIVTADADGYHRRTVVLKDIYQQQRVYLLNDTTTNSVEVRFQVDDQTGRYSDNPYIVVKKPLTINGTTEYRIVAAGDEGVNGFATFLESGVRYRIHIENENGDSRTLGPYRAPVSETVILTVGELTFGTTDSNGYTYGTSYADSATSGSGKQVVFNYSDPAGTTTDLDVAIYERGNTSNELLNQTYAGPFGNKSVAVGVPAAENNTVWVVDFEANVDGTTINDKQIVGPRSDLVGGLDNFWKRVGSILILFMVAGMFSRVNASFGAIITAIMAGMLWQIGWMGGATSGAAILIAIAAGVWLFYSSQQPSF